MLPMISTSVGMVFPPVVQTEKPSQLIVTVCTECSYAESGHRRKYCPICNSATRTYKPKGIVPAK